MAYDTKIFTPKIGISMLIGVGMMIGGMWLSANWHPEFIESLEKQGIPLDLGKTIAVIGVFMLLFPIIKFFFLNPLMESINDRNGELEKTFTEAENLRAEMTQMKSEYEQRIVATEAQAREQIQAQIKEAQDLRKELMAEAAAKADELVKKAQEEIVLEKDRVLTAMRLEVVNLTLAATEKVLGENVDDARNRKLIQEFVEKVEVPG